MGKIVPNSYQKPNLYTDRLMRYLTGDEWKTLDYAMRRTFGWNKLEDRISVSQFRNGNGRLGEDGYPVECGTGLGQGAQIKAIDELMRFGVLIEVAPNNDRKEGRLWALQLDEAQVRFDLIHERYEAQQHANRRRTARAREAAVERRADVATGEAASDGAMTPAATPARLDPVDNSIGLSDRPMTPVCGTDRYRSVGQTDTGLWDRPIPVCGTDPQKDSKKSNRNTHERQSVGAAVRGAWDDLLRICDGNAEQAGVVWQLAEKFAAVSQLRLPNPATADGRASLARDWWGNLKFMLEQADNDPATTEATLAETYQLMDERGLNISSPKSAVNVATSILARGRRGTPAQPLAQRPKGMAGIDAYAARRGIPNGN